MWHLSADADAGAGAGAGVGASTQNYSNAKPHIIIEIEFSMIA